MSEGRWDLARKYHISTNFFHTLDPNSTPVWIPCIQNVAIVSQAKCKYKILDLKRVSMSICHFLENESSPEALWKIFMQFLHGLGQSHKMLELIEAFVIYKKCTTNHKWMKPHISTIMNHCVHCIETHLNLHLIVVSF